MTMAPLKLLLSGYALSGLAAAGLAAQGAGVLAALLLFWLGGAAAVFALATAPGVRGAFRDEARLATAPEDAGASLARLERDRAENARPPAVRAAG